MNNLAKEKSIYDITPDNLNNDLIASLVGYETINVYNNIIRLMPFSKLLDSAIKDSGKIAFATTQHWITKVETPFIKTYLAIESVFLKDPILEDLQNELNKYLENPNQSTLNDIDDIVKDCKAGLEKNSDHINDTCKEVDKFRELLSCDAQNFQDIEKRLPDIIKNNDEKITEKKNNIKKTQQTITDLSTQIREKELKLVEVNKDISKAGIACAIPIVNIGGAIAMAVLLSKKSSINNEIKSLEQAVDQSKESLVDLNAKLDRLNAQAPLLTSMTTQVPILFALSEASATVAQAIKGAWTNIAFGLDELNTSLTVTEELTKRRLKNLEKKIKEQQNDLKKLMENYKNSMLLGIPVAPDAQKAFGLAERIGSRYYTSNIQTGILYLPKDELYEITSKIHLSFYE